MRERELDDRDLSRAFHAAFDGARPRPDAPDRAFEAVAAAGNRAHVIGRRLAGAAAVVLALLVVVVLQVQRAGLTPPSPTQSTAGRPAASTQMPALSIPAGRSPAPGEAANSPYPEVVAAVSTRVAMAGWNRPGRVALTLDGGATWTAMRPVPGSDASVLDVQWVDDDTAFVSTSAGLYRYGHSADSWTRLSTRADLVRLDFRDRVTGYAVTAAGDVVETGDGGQTLAARDLGIHPVTWLQWVGGKAWAAGPQGVIATSDGGVSWVRQLTFPTGDDVAVQSAQVGFRDGSNGFALFDVAGGPANQRAYVVYHTTDGGATWTAESCTCGPVPVPNWLRKDARPGLPGVPHGALVVTGAASAMLVSDDAAAATTSICITADSGRTWTCRPAPFAVRSGALAVKDRTWLLAAETASGPVIAVTGDAGESWTTRSI